MNVDIFVNTSAHEVAVGGQTIGTDGCGPCVGLIVMPTAQVKHCFHISCEAQATNRAAIEHIRVCTRGILQLGIPRPFPNTLQYLGCTTGFGFRETLAIIEVIREYFGNLPGEIRHGMGVGIDELNVLRLTDGNENVIVRPNGRSVINDKALIVRYN